jgi:hypothetical protein
MRRKLKEAAEKIVAEAKDLPAAATALAERLASDKALCLLAAFIVIERLPKRAGRRRELPSRRRAGAHRAKAKLPTAAQKTGALRAEQASTEMIYERKLRGGRQVGDVRMHEIKAIAEMSADNSLKFLFRGFEDAVEFFALTAISKHCVASDPYAKLRDIVKPSIIAKAFQKGAIDATEAMRDGAGELKRRLIAAAQSQELPAS